MTAEKNEDLVLLNIENGVATITLNRPAAGNALDAKTVAAVVGRVDEVAAASGVRVVLIRANGPSFGAGADLGWLNPADGGAPERVDAVLRLLNPMLEKLRAMPAIVVAAVHGVVAGGSLGLMNVADLVIAAAGTRFTLAYAKIGATPDMGASYFLPRIVGERRALELMLLSDVIDADRAERIGLVNRVCEADRFDAEVAALVERLRTGAAGALARTKALGYRSWGASMAGQLEEERLQLIAATSGAEFIEGVGAFAEKRRPRFA